MSQSKTDTKTSEYLQPSALFAELEDPEALETEKTVENDDDEALRLISCLNTGKCKSLQLEKDDFAVDLAEDADVLDLKGAEITENGDFVFKNHPVITVGRRNGDWYSPDALKRAVHYQKDRKTRKHIALSKQPARFVIKHTNHPLKVVGSVGDLHYSENPSPGIYGDYTIYNDPDIPASKTAVALLKRWSDEGSVHMPTSARFVVRRQHTKEFGSAVDNLRLVHVAWVELPADENAGVHVDNEAEPVKDLELKEETKGETPMADEQKEEKTPITEAPVTPPADNEAVTQKEETQKEEIVKDEETITVNVADLDQIVEARVAERVPKIAADLKAQIEAEHERSVLLTSISEKDEEVDKDFLASLDNKQLTALDALLAGYTKQFGELNEKVVQLEAAGTDYHDYEKSTYAGGRPHRSNDEIDEIVKKYYPVPDKMSAGAKQLADWITQKGGSQ